MSPRTREAADATADLVLRAGTGDRDALDRLFEQAAPRALLFVGLRLGPRLRAKVEAVDVLQDAYLDALAALPTFRYRGEGSFSRWLCRLIENRIRGLADWHGAGKRRPPGREERLSGLLARLLASSTGPATGAHGRDRDARLATALGRLPEAEREVLLLRYFQDRTIDEIAGLLARIPSSVRRTIGRATSRIGEVLLEGDAP